MKNLALDAFFQKMEADGMALAFKDVRLKSGYSQVLPPEVSVRTQFSRKVTLNSPVVSAAMDTVTESTMAIAMAKAGGIGVIHRKFATPAQQAEEVERVKLYLNAIISKPICVYEDDTIETIESLREEKMYSFQSFPVLNRQGRLIGLLTRNDFDLCQNVCLPAREAMTQKLITAPVGTTLVQAYALMIKEKKKVLPITDTEGKVTGMYIFSDVKRVMEGNSQSYNIDSAGHLRVAAAIGTGDSALGRATLLANASVDVIVIDTAHGDSKPVFETLKEIKRAFPDIDVVVGNVSEGASAKRLVDAGADGIKVGQGSGSICTTRMVAGIGCPQVTAIYNCAKAIQDSGVPVCADGGIEYSGDITVAIGAGAHSVMLGNLLAGTEETPGEIITIDDMRYKHYRGMGSLGVMIESRESRNRYGQTNLGKDKLVPEGVEGAVPCKGPVEKSLYQYVGGLRSGMGYVGARTIEELQEKADFYRISSAGLAESHPHNIRIVKDAPNY